MYEKIKIISILVVAILFASIAQAQSIVPIRGTSIDVNMAKYSPIPAEANKYVTVWFDVTNKGNEIGENITFLLEPKYPFSLPDNDPVRRITVPALTTMRIEYRLFVDKNAPDAPGEIKLTYTLGPNARVEKTFNITVENTVEEADLHALFVSAKPLPYPGGKTEVSIDVVNANKGTAYYVMATASSPIADIESERVFIGTLEANDFDNIDFELKIKDNVEPGIYPLTLNFVYRDKDSRLYNSTDYVNIRVFSAKEALPSQAQMPVWMYAVYILIALLAIRLLLPFLKWFIKPFKRKKHSKGHEQVA